MIGGKRAAGAVLPLRFPEGRGRWKGGPLASLSAFS